MNLEIKGFKKYRGAKKSITFRGKTSIVKVSILCQYCPNRKCQGYYRRDAPRACLTFKSWKEGKISLEKAIEMKHKQNERHTLIDPIRKKIYQMIIEWNKDYGEYFDRDMLYSFAYSVASEIVKGVPIDEALKETPFYFDEKQRKQIYEALKPIKNFIKRQH